VGPFLNNVRASRNAREAGAAERAAGTL